MKLRFYKNVVIFLKSSILVLLWAVLVYSQIRIGGTFGLSKANLIFDISDSSFSSDPKNGYTFGALIEYPLTSFVNLRSGVNFTQKGLEDSQDFFDATIDTRLNLSYFTIPILAHYRFNPAVNFAYAIGGMEVGFLLSAESVEIISGFPIDIGFIKNGTTIVNIKDSLSAVDITWNIGGGYKMEIGNRNIFAELQFTFGLNDIDGVDEKIIVKSRGIIIGIGYIY